MAALARLCPALTTLRVHHRVEPLDSFFEALAQLPATLAALVLRLPEVPPATAWPLLERLTSICIPDQNIDHQAAEGLANLPRLRDLEVGEFHVDSDVVVRRPPCAWQRLTCDMFDPVEQVLYLPLTDGVKVTVQTGGYGGDNTWGPQTYLGDAFGRQMEVLGGCLSGCRNEYGMDMTLEILPEPGVLPRGTLAKMVPFLATGFIRSLVIMPGFDEGTADELVAAAPRLGGELLLCSRVASGAWGKLSALTELERITVGDFTYLCDVGDVQATVKSLMSLALSVAGRTLINIEMNDVHGLNKCFSMLHRVCGGAVCGGAAR